MPIHPDEISPLDELEAMQLAMDAVIARMRWYEARPAYRAHANFLRMRTRLSTLRRMLHRALSRASRDMTTRARTRRSG